MVDRFSRWPEAIPLPNIEAETVANALLENWITRYGTPDTITTDQGTQFESRLFNQLTKRLGTNRIHTSAYNPRANGMVERFHRQLKDSLRCLNGDPQWSTTLPLIMLGIRSCVKEDLKHSPAEIVFGTNLKLPADLVAPQEDIEITDFVARLRSKLSNLQSADTRVPESESFIPKDLLTCKYVFIRKDAARKPLERPYTGPYRVIKRNKHTFTLDTPNGSDDVNIGRLKPANVDKKTVTFNLPKKRGRPRKNPA